jgi:hypothetical protein
LTAIILMPPAFRCRPGPSSGIRLRLSPEVAEVEAGSALPIQVTEFGPIGAVSWA